MTVICLRQEPFLSLLNQQLLEQFLHQQGRGGVCGEKEGVAWSRHPRPPGPPLPQVLGAQMHLLDSSAVAESKFGQGPEAPPYPQLAESAVLLLPPTGLCPCRWAGQAPFPGKPLSQDAPRALAHIAGALLWR